MIFTVINNGNEPPSRMNIAESTGRETIISVGVALCFTAQPSNYKLNTFVYIRYRGLPASGRFINIHEMHLTVCNIYIWTQVTIVSRRTWSKQNMCNVRLRVNRIGEYFICDNNGHGNSVS